MHKKLQKYIYNYELIKENSYELIPDGGMNLLINISSDCEFSIGEECYSLEASKSVLLNAYESTVLIKSNELIIIRFKGAGASFFFDELMETLMLEPLSPIFLQDNITQSFTKNYDEKALDSYLKNRFQPSTAQFNMMKIIELVEKECGEYRIEELLLSANVPRRIFEKLFRLKTGLSIKTYAQLRKNVLTNAF